MAPLAESIAGKVLGSAAKEAITALCGYLHPYGSEDIQQLEGNLQFILSELESLSASEQTHNGVKKWMTNARELVYDIEDIRCRFQSAGHNNAKPDGIKKLFVRVRKSLNEIKNCREYFFCSEEIKRAKAGVAASKEMFGALPMAASGCHENDLRYHPLNVLNSTGLVGMDGPAEEIISLLDIAGVQDAKEGVMANPIGHKVVAIVGVGGLGKTTLAAQVCNEIKGKFHCWARVFVTRNRGSEGILISLLHEFDIYDCKLHGADVTTLVRRIQEHVQDKRFLIIFDDVWNNDVLEDVNNALFGNPCGGRIIMTTRRNDVAEEWISYHEKENKGCCSTKWGGDYRIKPLNEEDSRKLLRKNVSPRKLQTSEEYMDTILAKCGGSPLALTAVSDVVTRWGGDTIPWDKVYRRIIEINAPPKIQSMRKDLSHSYFDLPYDKRDCFLYLSLFPNDEINKKRLVSRWIAEGLIAKEEGKETFKKLVDSNLILKPKIKYDGDESIYQVHPSIHDFVVWKSAEYNFLTLPGAIDQTDRKIRRISVHRNTEGRENIKLGAKRLPDLRSLSMFGAGVPPKEMSSVLRVLDLEGCTNGDTDSEMVPSSEKKSGDIKPGELLHRNLRYLKLKEGLKGFDCHKYVEKPTKDMKRIGSAKNLQTLDLRGFGSIILDKAVTDLVCLARLLVDPETRLPGGIGKMKALEELQLIDVSRCGEDDLVELGQLPELRAMGIHLSAEITEENSLHLLNALRRLMEEGSLKSLSIDGVGIHLTHDSCIWGLALKKFRMMIGCHFNEVPDTTMGEQKLKFRLREVQVLEEQKLKKPKLGVTEMEESATQALNAFASRLTHLFLDLSGDIKYNIANKRFPNLICLGIRSTCLKMELTCSMGVPQHLKFQLHADDCTRTDLPDGFYCATQHITSLNTIPGQRNHNNEQATWTVVHIITTPPRDENDKREVVVAITIEERSATLSIKVKHPQHGHDYNWRHADLDVSALYRSGEGERHGRFAMFNGIVDSDVALSQGRSSVSSTGSARLSRSADAARIAQYEEDMAQMSAALENMQPFLQFGYLAPLGETSQFAAPPRPFYYGGQPPPPGEPLNGSELAPPPQGSQPPPPYYYGGPPPVDTTQGSQPCQQYCGWPPHMYYSYPPGPAPAPALAPQGSASHHGGEEPPNPDMDINILASGGSSQHSNNPDA